MIEEGSILSTPDATLFQNEILILQNKIFSEANHTIHPYALQSCAVILRGVYWMRLHYVCSIFPQREVIQFILESRNLCILPCRILGPKFR